MRQRMQRAGLRALLHIGECSLLSASKSRSYLRAETEHERKTCQGKAYDANEAHKR